MNFFQKKNYVGLMKKFYLCHINILKSCFLTKRLQILTFLIKNKKSNTQKNPKQNCPNILRIHKVYMVYDKNNILLKDHFPVVVAYHESSSKGYSSFFSLSK